MILVYSLLTGNREYLVNQLVAEIRSESKLYHRISRIELKESVAVMLDAYTEFMISHNQHKLKIILGYWVHVRLSQSFHFGAILKAALCFAPVLRLFFQDAYRKMPEQEAATYNKAMKCLEKALFKMTEILIEIFEEQKETPRLRKNLDLSKMMIFRG